MNKKALINLKQISLSTALLTALVFTHNAVSENGYSTGNNKDWQWDTTKATKYAVTVNNQGSLLGKFCSSEDGSCIYMTYLGTDCEERSKRPATLSSNAGTLKVTLGCKHLSDNHYFSITQPEKVEALVKRSDYLKISMEVKPNQVRQEEFSMAGSAKAIENLDFNMQVLCYRGCDGK
ncbi:hypothetical protein [Halioxenophilus sp. WMMB6]|uniref:hypothetical protein n=1 Tax=Halioxenophilus sp. WMMB6 TaxID=3073815 RepID=UPI00295F2647|nr:hypothetical protein [Halioxenophilus sp. WMMB6]